MSCTTGTAARLSRRLMISIGLRGVLVTAVPQGAAPLTDERLAELKAKILDVYGCSDDVHRELLGESSTCQY